MPVGNRRMLSPLVTQSGRFLMMPLESQALYFHLNLSADDDGVVEAYTVMRQIGAKEDSMAMLIGKGFVKVLDNEQQIVWITNWSEHNQIRQDRLVPSIYRSLLVQVIDGITLPDSTRDEANIRRLKRYYQIEKTSENPPPRKSAETPRLRRIPAPRIGKDSIGKDSKTITPLPPKGGGVITAEDERYLALWENVVGTKLRSKLEENVKAAKKLEGAVGIDGLKRLVAGVRLIRMDQYSPRSLSIGLVNYCAIQKKLEELEAYIAGNLDKRIHNQPKRHTT